MENKDILSFEKGIDYDTDLKRFDQGYMRESTNARFQSKEGSSLQWHQIQGTTKSFAVPDKCKIIGLKSFDNYLFVFYTGERQGIAYYKNEDIPDQYIVKENKTLTGYTNLKGLYENSELNFQKYINKIEAEVQFDYSINLYFTDGSNPPRRINTNTTYDNITQINLLKSFKLPKISINKDFIQTNGKLRSGTYRVIVRYANDNFEPTNFSYPSQNIIITTKTNPENWWEYDGGRPDSQTNKSFTVKLSELDQNYTYIQLGVIYYKTNVSIEYFLTDFIKITGFTQNVTITGDELSPTDRETLSLPFIAIESCKSLAIINNRLFLSNLKYKYNLIQKAKDVIKKSVITWKTTKFSYKEGFNSLSNEEFPLSGLKGIALSNKEYLQPYQNEYNIYNYVGYRRGKRYKFAIEFVFKDGSRSTLYELPGDGLNNDNSYTVPKNLVADFNPHNRTTSKAANESIEDFMLSRADTQNFYVISPELQINLFELSNEIQGFAFYRSEIIGEITNQACIFKFGRNAALAGLNYRDLIIVCPDELFLKNTNFSPDYKITQIHEAKTSYKGINAPIDSSSVALMASFNTLNYDLNNTLQVPKLIKRNRKESYYKYLLSVSSGEGKIGYILEYTDNYLIPYDQSIIELNLNSDIKSFPENTGNPQFISIIDISQNLTSNVDSYYFCEYVSIEELSETENWNYLFFSGDTYINKTFIRLLQSKQPGILEGGGGGKLLTIGGGTNRNYTGPVTINIGIVTENFYNTCLRFSEELETSDKYFPLDLSFSIPIGKTEEYLSNSAFMAKDVLNLPTVNKFETSEQLYSPSEIRYSRRKQIGSKSDSYTLFDPLSTSYTDLQYGEIVEIQNFKNQLFVAQRQALSVIPIDMPNAATNDAGISYKLGEFDVISSRPQYIDQKFGTQHQWSIVQSDQAIYGVDRKMTEIWRVGPNGFEILSLTKKIESFARHIMSYENVFKDYEIITGFDPLYNEVYFTFNGNANQDTLVFSENFNVFIGKYFLPEKAFQPTMYCSYMNDHYAVNSNGGLFADRSADPSNLYNTTIWKFNSGDLGNFWGFASVPSKIILVSNSLPTVVKVFNTLKMYVKFFDLDSQQTLNTLPKDDLFITFRTSSQKSDKLRLVEFLSQSDYTKEGFNFTHLVRNVQNVWHMYVPRESNKEAINGYNSRLRDTYLEIEIESYNTNNIRTFLNFLELTFNPAYR
jgi:hypothetical protein